MTAIHPPSSILHPPSSILKPLSPSLHHIYPERKPRRVLFFTRHERVTSILSCASPSRVRISGYRKIGKSENRVSCRIPNSSSCLAEPNTRSLRRRPNGKRKASFPSTTRAPRTTNSTPFARRHGRTDGRMFDGWWMMQGTRTFFDTMGGRD